MKNPQESGIHRQVEVQLRSVCESNQEVIAKTTSFLVGKIAKMINDDKHYLLVADPYGRDWRIASENSRKVRKG